MADDDAQHNVRFHFESSGLAGVAIEPTSVHLQEALSEPYGVEIQLAIGDPDADPAQLLGNDCVLSFERVGGEMRRVCGIARAVHHGDRPGETAWARVVVVPALWFLSRRRDTRIFQDQSVPEILAAVLGGALGDYGRAHQLTLDRTYEKREFCVQYDETDLDFCHRLMEEEGIFYFFDHEGEKEKLVLVDANSSCAPIPAGTVPYRSQNAQFTVEPAHLVHKRYRDTTTSTVVSDWDWTKNGAMGVTSEARTTDALERDREQYEHGEARSLRIGKYAPRAYGHEDGADQARVRTELAVRDQVRLDGVGRVTTMAPGTTFELVDHPVVGLDGSYLVTRVWHMNRPAEELIMDQRASSTDLYRNVFECIPLDTPFRPDRRTPKPVIPSIQTAVVTGPAGEEIHVDEHGRIKVHFHWDRVGALDENSSCWIRVEQAWAGPSWGFWWVPRIGMEVVVQFIDGDADRPFVTGCVYDGTNATPYPLPDEKTKSTIKSNSSIGGGGSNEFRFEDKAGSEEIYTHAQKDYNEVVENDHNTLVHHDQTNTVDNNQTQEIKNNQTETVNGNQSLTVDANRTVHVQANFDETVDGTETRTVTGAVTETFDANEDRTIGANLDETFSANETRTISGNQDETITASQTRTITGSSTVTISGSLSQNIVGGVTSTTPGAHDVVAVGGYTVTTPAMIQLVAPGGVKIIAPGGTGHVDSFDSWFASRGYSTGAVGWECFATKFELLGAAFGVTGLKVELCGLSSSTDGALVDKWAGPKISAEMVKALQMFRVNIAGITNKG